MTVDPVLASIHALPARFRQRFATRLGGVALAVQALEWCCLGIPPALLARNPHTWQSLMGLIATYFAMAGISAALTTLCPPRRLRLHALLTGCALAAASAFLLVLHPQLPVIVVATLLGGASLGAVQVQTATLRAWLTTPPPSQINALWSWGAAIVGCVTAGLLTSLTVWTVPLWLTAWAILVAGWLILRVPQPPLAAPPTPSSWRASIMQVLPPTRQLDAWHRVDGVHLCCLILWLVMQVTVPASALLTHHVSSGVAIAWLAFTQIALVAGMRSSGIAHPLAQRWPHLTTPQGLGGAVGVLALVSVGSFFTGHLFVALLAAFLLGLVRALTSIVLASPHQLVAPLAYLGAALFIGLAAGGMHPPAAFTAGGALSVNSGGIIHTFAQCLGEGGCR